MQGVLLSVALFVLVSGSTAGAPITSVATGWTVQVLDMDAEPLISAVAGTSAFQQAFNPSYVQPTAATGQRQGLLVRSQNCSAAVGGACVRCAGTGAQASVVAFAEFAANATGAGAAPPELLHPLAAADVVFAPHNATDSHGTEDPRLAFDPRSGLYALFYTAWGGGSSIELSLATTRDPTRSSGWTRHGPVGFGPGSKSAALLVPAASSAPYHLLWGDTSIRLATSSSLTSWPDKGSVLISPRKGSFDSSLVEAGPPPLTLSSGDYLFFYNSANESSAYHVGYLVLSRQDPSVILARSEQPLISPSSAFARGVVPYTCNVPNVVFLEGAAPTATPDTFRVFFGAADACVGTALVHVQTPSFRTP